MDTRKTRKSTIRDVSELAGVSISTVSRILNNREKAKTVPEEVRNRVLQCADELNYVPNANARRVFTHRAGIIGLLVPSHTRMDMHIFEDGHLTRLISGVEEGIGKSDYRLLLIFNDERFMKKREYMSLVQSQNIDGLLVWGAQPNETYWREPVEAGLPIMFAVTAPGKAEQFHFVGNATRQGTRIALDEFRRGGHRNILYIRDPKKQFILSEIDTAIQQFQVDCPEIRLETLCLEFEQRDDLPYDRFLTPGGPTAILAYNYAMAADAVKALRNHGFRVPDDLEVIAAYSFRSRKNRMSTIEVDDFEIGRTAITNLLRLIESPEKPAQNEIPCRLFLGETTRCPVSPGQ